MDNLGDVFNGAGYVPILCGVTRGNALLAALVLSATAACSDPKAGTLPSTSPSASMPSVTASPSASVDPEAWLIAAAHRFYEVLEVASSEPGARAGDVEALLHRSCECRRIVEFLRAQGQRGRYIERPVAVVNPRATPTDEGGTVFLTLKQDAGHVRDSQGRVVEELKPSRDEVVLDFTTVNGALVITQLTTKQR